ANAARQKPYASPLKQSQTSQSPANQAKQHASSTSSSTSWSPTPTRPSATSKTASAKSSAPVTRPEQAAQTHTADPGVPLPLSAYPHPNGDNGRGMHWVPTTKQPKAVVDKFVAEAQRMGVKWVTFLNDGANVGDNDYLVDKLVGAGIEPLMRLYSSKLEPIKGDVQAMVQHYVAKGVHYFQPF